MIDNFTLVAIDFTSVKITTINNTDVRTQINKNKCSM